MANCASGNVLEVLHFLRHENCRAPAKRRRSGDRRIAASESRLCGIAASGGRLLARTVLRGVVAAAARKSTRRDEPDPSAESVSASGTTEAADDPLRPLVRHPPPSAAPRLAGEPSASAARRERARAADREAPPLLGSGWGGEAEDRAQGGGGRPVRGRRAEARAWRWRGIPRRSHATRIGRGWRGRAHGPARREG